MAKESVRPSRRWAEVERQMPAHLDSGSIGVYLADATEDGKELDRLFDKLEDTTTGAMAEMIRKVRDLCCDVSSEAGRRSYDIGYGDGWHAGALVAVRALAGAGGAQVPQPSPGLSILVGLPYEPVPHEPVPPLTFDPPTERKPSFVSGLYATTKALELSGHPALAAQIVKALTRPERPGA